MANSDDHLQLVKDTTSPGSAERPILSGPSACFRHNGCCWEPTSPFASGRRALDILIALVERAGEVVSKDRLVARVSPNTFVEDGNLKFQIGGLRRALGEGRSGSRYLVTIPRRGYLFVAPVTIAEEAASEAPLAAETRRQDNLPVRLTRLIRGAVTVSSLVGQVLRLRLLPIVGLAGIGKISVALAVAEELVGTYQHGVWLIDLAALDYPRLLAAALAAALGLDIRSEILFQLDRCAKRQADAALA